MNNHDNLNDYFNAAKNSGADFTHRELERVVEAAPDDNNRGRDGYFTYFTIRTIRMILLSSTFVSALIGGWLWLAPATTPIEQHNRTESSTIQQTNTQQKSVQQKSVQEQERSGNSRIAGSTPIIEQPKEQIPTHRQPKNKIAAVGSAQNNAAVTQKNHETLDIDGLTSIALDKDEIEKLGITVGNDCGITLKRDWLATTYYNLNHHNKTYYYNRYHRNSPMDSMAEANGFLRESKDTNDYFTSVTTMGMDKKSDHQVNHPLLVTSLNGTILSDGLGSRINKESNTQAQQDSDSLRKNNPENKPTMMFYLYPKDSSMTQKEIEELRGDTSEYLTIFKRLSQADVDQMEREKAERSKKISDYLRLNKLVAVKVESECPNTTLVFWYEPSEEFINTLPVRYKAGLYKEMLGIDLSKVTTDTLWFDGDAFPSHPQTGCQFSDICRATSGVVLESNVFPNPATEKIMLTFRLSEDRKCSFSLHDLNGIHIKALGKDIDYTKGEHTFTASIGDISPGVYLLSMHTDTGERIVQRVIIKK